MASETGILVMTRKLDHSKVPSTTMNITPTRAATGTISIKGDANTTKPINTSAAVIPEVRPRPPELMLIML